MLNNSIYKDFRYCQKFMPPLKMRIGVFYELNLADR